LLAELSLTLALILILTGCVASTETGVEIPTTAVILSIHPTETITSSPSPSSISVSPTRTPLPPPVPTLLPNEKENYLLNKIKTNGGCKLPCFLGIQPGISIWEDIREIEGPLYFREWYGPDKGDSISLYNVNSGKNVETLNVTFWGNKSAIERITVDTIINASDHISDDYYSHFSEAMKQYSLPTILSEYGIPTRVLLQVQGQVEPGAGTQAEILLFYDSLGVVVHYMFLDVVSQDSNTGILTACPNYEHVHFIRFYLQSPKDNTPLERMIGDENDHYLNSWLKPLEKLTTLNLRDFYSLFIDPNQSGCFDVP
jgi:hypothetical protein